MQRRIQRVALVLIYWPAGYLCDLPVMRARIFAPFLAPGQPKPCRNRAAAMLLRPLVPPTPKGCLPSPRRGLQRSPRLRDIYRAAIQRSGRSWKAIAGKAVSRPKVSKNDSSSSSAPLMPTSEEWTRDHSPSMKAHASPGAQRAGMPSQSTNLGSILTIWGSGWPGHRQPGALAELPGYARAASPAPRIRKLRHGRGTPVSPVSYPGARVVAGQGN